MEHMNLNVHFITGNMNCSLGQPRLFDHTWECLDTTRQLIGLYVGVMASVLWSAGHVCLYRFKRMRTRSSRQRSVRLFLMMNWFSDALGCVGAGLSQQLLSQMLFGVTVTCVHTICCIHSFFSPVNKPLHESSKRDRNSKKFGHNRLSKKTLFRACICPLNAIFLVTTFVLLSAHGFITASARTADERHRNIHTWMPVEWLVGYVFGSMAGVLHCCAKTLDVLDSYISVDLDRVMAVAYIVSILGEMGYVISVMSQRVSLLSYDHTLPWVLPRLLAAGIDMGILIQRIIQKRRGKRRKISEEDAECLLSSSESGHDWLSSESEEVIWVPLKSVDSAIPTHPVCASRVQILLESDKSTDTVDWYGSTEDTQVTDNLDEEGNGADSLRDDTDGTPYEPETEVPENGSDDSKDYGVHEKDPDEN